MQNFKKICMLRYCSIIASKFKLGGQYDLIKALSIRECIWTHSRYNLRNGPKPKIIATIPRYQHSYFKSED